MVEEDISDIWSKNGYMVKEWFKVLGKLVINQAISFPKCSLILLSYFIFCPVKQSLAILLLSRKKVKACISSSLRKRYQVASRFEIQTIDHIYRHHDVIQDFVSSLVICNNAIQVTTHLTHFILFSFM
jgi:hypothetical protein